MPLTTQNTIDYWERNLPKCPFCDDEIDLAKNNLNELYDEGEHTIDCPSCDKEITVSVSVSFSFSFSFSTDEQPDPE
jgi:hypothetical protein